MYHAGSLQGSKWHWSDSAGQQEQGEFASLRKCVLSGVDFLFPDWAHLLCLVTRARGNYISCLSVYLRSGLLLLLSLLSAIFLFVYLKGSDRAFALLAWRNEWMAAYQKYWRTLECSFLEIYARGMVVRRRREAKRFPACLFLWETQQILPFNTFQARWIFAL